MIKNWFVGAKQIRDNGIKHKYKKIISTNGNSKFERISGSGKRIKNGFSKHVRYLNDENASSHSFSNIHVIFDKAGNILSSINDRTTYRQENGIRGGGVLNYSTAMVLALPRDIKQPSLDDWKRIADQLIIDVAKVNNIKIDILKEHTHVVLHDESKSPDKNSHIHVLFPNVLNNVVVKGISQRKTVHAAKMSFNRSVLNVLGVCNTTYTPEQENVSDVPLWAARAAKAESDLKIISRAKEMRKYLIEFKDNIKNDIVGWSEDFINNIFPKVEKSSLIVADAINLIEKIDPQISDELDSITDFVEQKKADAPGAAKVSTKRKRRRRKS
jgi:hypothetical protein